MLILGFNQNGVIHMFVQIKRNKSGSKSIIIAHSERVPGKKNPLSHKIKSFGTAKTEEELNKLIAQAEKEIKILEAEANIHKPLIISSSQDITSSQSRKVGFNEIYGNIFANTITNTGLSPTACTKLQDLVCMRIANPCSKRKTARISSQYGLDINMDNTYKFMDKLDEKVITQIQKSICNSTKLLLQEQKQSIDVLFYDLTTIYFENNSADRLRDFGFSKDGKHSHVQIMMAMMVTKSGLPIGYELFPGNSFEGHTLIPCLLKLKEKYEIDKVVLVADAALMNEINLDSLTEHGFDYIISAKLKNMQAALKKEILKEDGYEDLAINGGEQSSEDKIRYKIIDPKDFYTDVRLKKIDEKKALNEVVDDGKLIVYYSAKRARKDQHDREKALQKIEKYLRSTTKSKLTGCLKKSYVKLTEESKLEIDEIKLEKDKEFDGYFGIKSNVENLDPAEVLSHYRGLWQVEQTFRVAKSNLEIRPVFHWSEKRIRAHFIICYAALACMRFAEFKLKLANCETSADEMHLLLEQVKVTVINTKTGHNYYIRDDLPSEVPQIYRALGLKIPQKFGMSS